MSNLVINANSIYDRIIRIGRQTENLVSSITFNVQMWIDEYGLGECVLNVRRNGDGSAYPVPMTIADGMTTWTITDTDTSKKGRGEIQLVYRAGDKVKTSPIFTISCGESLVGGEVPEPYEEWLTELNRMTAQVEAAKTSASASAQTARTAETSATASAQTATTKASEATASAQSASVSAATAQNASTSASQSATNASTSASQASASAESASGSATSAQTSATNASTSATQASESATQASTSATNASTSASLAQEYAEQAEESAAALSDINGRLDDVKAYLNYRNEYENSINKPLFTNYVIGVYDSFGNLGTQYTYGISSPLSEKLSFADNIVLLCEDGFAYAIQYYTSDGTFIRTDRWHTDSVTIPAESIFTISIRPEPLAESVPADIENYRKKVRVQSEVERVQSEVESVQSEVKVLISPTVIRGEIVDTSGQFVENTSYERSDYVDVVLVSSIIVEKARLHTVSCFNVDKVFIGYRNGTSYPATYELLPDTRYVIFNGFGRVVENAYIYLNRKTVETRLSEAVSEAVSEAHSENALQDIAGVSKFPGNLAIAKECVDNAFVNCANGTIVSNHPNYFCTGYIPVVEGETYRANVGRNYAWYDTNKSYISGEIGTGIQTSKTAPTGAAYIRITINKASDNMTDPRLFYFANIDDYSLDVIIPGLVGTEIRPWCYGKKINWIGDSIVDGRDFDEEVCEALGLVKNSEYGINGSTIALNSDGTDGRNALCERYVNMSDDADIIAVSCGTNDFEYAWSPIGTIDSTEKTTFYGALKTLCEGLINKYPTKMIFFTTPIKRAQPFASGAGGEYTEDGVMTTPFSKNKYGKTLGDYADIIKEVCGYYSIPVLDMYRESLLNPHLASQQNMFDSVYTHPNTTGQKIMARRVAGWISQLGYTIPNLT